VWSARALIEFKITLRNEFVSILEVALIIISSPGVLRKLVLINKT
jgi:hypothetical protein